MVVRVMATGDDGWPMMKRKRKVEEIERKGATKREWIGFSLPNMRA